MHTMQIMKMMENISRDYAGIGRAKTSLDNIIKNEIIRLYNNLPIDWEEVKFLWIDWLENGRLSVSDAMEMQKKRNLSYTIGGITRCRNKEMEV